jgi:CHASE2 domain-containing sensor protein
MSFSDLVRGTADTAWLRDRVVVVGASAPTLQDVHATPASTDQLMSGPEVQANAIWSALHGLPLRDAPGWVGWIAIAVAGLAPALAAVGGRAVRATVLGLGLGLGSPPRSSSLPTVWCSPSAIR